MKKVVSLTLSLFCALLIGCQGEPTASSDMDSPESSSIESSSNSVVESSEGNAEDDIYLEQLESIMKELGETNPIKNLRVEEPHTLESLESGENDYKYIDAYFAVGDRELYAAFSLDDGEVSLISVSKADDRLRYYYFKDAAEINTNFPSVGVDLYDYETDKKLPRETVEPDNEHIGIDKIVEKYSSFMEKNESETDDSQYTVNVYLESPRNDPEQCASEFCLAALSFIQDYTELEYEELVDILFFDIYVEDESIGMMLFNTNVAMMGSQSPFILDAELRDAFSEKYDELLGELDYTNFED